MGQPALVLVLDSEHKEKGLWSIHMRSTSKSSFVAASAEMLCHKHLKSLCGTMCGCMSLQVESRLTVSLAHGCVLVVHIMGILCAHGAGPAVVMPHSGMVAVAASFILSLCRGGLTRIFALSACVVPVCHVQRVCVCVCVCVCVNRWLHLFPAIDSLETE